MIKTLHKNKTSGPYCFIGEFYQTFREELSFSNFSNKLQRKEHSQGHSMRLPSTQYQEQTKRSHKKENYRPTSLMNIDVKILNKILQTESNNIKRIIHHD